MCAINKIKGKLWLFSVHCSVIAAQFSSGFQEYDKPVVKTSIPGPRSKVTSDPLTCFTSCLKKNNCAAYFGWGCTAGTLKPLPYTRHIQLILQPYTRLDTKNP